jgi:GrpB-like predicted nucleotidyltransferase (UPF0157 family)
MVSMSDVTDAVPLRAYEQPEIRPCDPRWSRRAAIECARLADLLPLWADGGVEHVGSTAVPG